MAKTSGQIKREIQRLVSEYCELEHGKYGPQSEKEKFVPGTTPVPYARRVFETEEMSAAIETLLDFRLTLGDKADSLQQELADWLGVGHSVLVNSGSSANLLALTALASPGTPETCRIRRGDEVITCAAGFPTTVTPVIQNGAVPVFIDNNPITGNAETSMLEAAYAPGRTKAVLLAHALGNPFNLSEVVLFCAERELMLIEDNCDALGCTYSVPRGHALHRGDQEFFTRPTGAWGDMSTQSFYAAHHITMGEGGAVNIKDNPVLASVVGSLRDWGRDCWCATGEDNACGTRFGSRFGQLPAGYDHKFVFSRLGYNLKPLDIQAAIGSKQLKRLTGFTRLRKENWLHLRKGLAELQEYFVFSLPTHATRWNGDGFDWDQSGCRTECSWFGFLVMVRPGAPFNNTNLARHLDSKNIGNRMFLGGNLTRQPAFIDLIEEDQKAFRTVGPLTGADRLMNEGLFVGTYPGLTTEVLDYVIETINDFVRQF